MALRAEGAGEATHLDDVVLQFGSVVDGTPLTPLSHPRLHE